MGVSQSEIAHRLGLARSTVTKILNQFPNNRASKETVRQVFQAAREMGYDFGRLRNIHRRRADRRKVDLETFLRIELDNGNGIFDTGTAVIRDLSPFGALLTSLRTNKKTIPLLPFTIELDLATPLDGISVKGRIIRMSTNDTVQLGLSFIDVSSDTERRILEFLD